MERLCMDILSIYSMKIQLRQAFRRVRKNENTRAEALLFYGPGSMAQKDFHGIDGQNIQQGCRFHNSSS